MKNFVLLSLVSLAVALNSCKKDFSPLEETGPVRPLNSAEKQLVESGQLIGFKIVSAGEDDNFFLVLNRPFVFAIREKPGGAIFFIGRIMHPEWDEV